MTKIIQYLPQLESKTYEIVFIKSYSSRGFQKFQKTHPNFPKNFNFYFIKKIENNSHTMGLNITKAPWCTLMHQGLSNSTKKTMGVPWREKS